jgi:hypothetical protein
MKRLGSSRGERERKVDEEVVEEQSMEREREREYYYFLNKSMREN